MKTTYEWIAEDVDKYGDIQDHAYGSTAKEAINGCPWDTYRLVLVKTIGDPYEGVVSREYAEVTNNQLPERFGDGSKVPKKFLTEFNRARNQESL